jgi:hypothetical protein
VHTAAKRSAVTRLPHYYNAEVPMIDDLVTLVPPPAEPVDAQGDWRSVEVSLGTALPADYKALIELYGLGMFVDFILLHTPFGPRASLLQRARDLPEELRGAPDQWLERFPYRVYPQPGGLLEWAATDLGDKLCWATEGPPNTWRVVVWPRHSDELGEYPMRAVEFLRGLLSGSVTCPMLVQPVVPVLWFDSWHELSETYVDLIGGSQPYRTRLRLLRQALAPTADRSGWPADEEPDDDDRQDKFAAVELGWRLMYEIHDGHQTIRVAYPPDDEERMHAVIANAVSAMGCRIGSMTKVR